MSSAMSAAKAAGDHMKSIWQGTAPGEWVSMGVVSDGSYGVPADVVYSFPVTIKDKKWTIVQVCLLDVPDSSQLWILFYLIVIVWIPGSAH